MLACLWWLADRNVLVALALVAFPPVAVEFWFRNIHLVLAVLLVLSVRRGWLFPVGAAIKLAPGIGIAWLAARGRWRDAGVAVGVGIVILAISIVISPGAWADWVAIATARGPGDEASFLPVPFLVRAVAGLALALAAVRVRRPLGGGAARRRGHPRAADAVDDRAQPVVAVVPMATPSGCGARSIRLMTLPSARPAISITIAIGHSPGRSPARSPVPAARLSLPSTSPATGRQGHSGQHQHTCGEPPPATPAHERKWRQRQLEHNENRLPPPGQPLHESGKHPQRWVPYTTISHVRGYTRIAASSGHVATGGRSPRRGRDDRQRDRPPQPPGQDAERHQQQQHHRRVQGVPRHHDYGSPVSCLGR